MKLFEPEDFTTAFSIFPESTTKAERDHAARIANLKFHHWLKSQPVVYGKAPEFYNEDWYQHEMPGVTHKARLVCIEEIKKCEHDDIQRVRGPHGYAYQCTSCKKELKLVE